MWVRLQYLWLAGLLLLAACIPINESVLPTVVVMPTTAPDDAQLCEQLIQEATQTVENTCANIGRNEVCYGNTRLEIQPRPDVRLGRFSAPGDMVTITAVESLRLSPLDTARREWGLALLALQANLPDTLPGQNVLVFLFGDVEWRNVADTQAYYLRTGIGDAPCAAAPESGILVQTPEGAAEIQLTINGVDIRLMSTAFIQAQPGAEMRVSLVEGQGIITAEAVTRVVPAGTGVTIPMTAELLPAAPPSEAAPYAAAAFETLPIDVLEREIEIAVLADAAAVNGGELMPTEEIVLTEEALSTEAPSAKAEVMRTTTDAQTDTLSAETASSMRDVLFVWMPRFVWWLDNAAGVAQWLAAVRLPARDSAEPVVVEDANAGETSSQEFADNVDSSTSELPAENVVAPETTVPSSADDANDDGDDSDDSDDAD